MAHPKRKEQFMILYEKLRKMPFTSVHLSVSTEENTNKPLINEWKTGKSALLHHDPNADWHVVLQDDAIISDTFYPNLENALSSRKSLVSLYLGKTRPHQDKILKYVNFCRYRQANWLVANDLFWGVGIAIPQELIGRVIEVAETVKVNYDHRIGYYFHLHQLPVYYTYPSLVDHADNGSLIPGHDERADGERKAHSFVGDKIISFDNKEVIEIRFF
jgi:hypothetical protein